MNYVDGYVAAVPTANREEYLLKAKQAAEIFKANGAIGVTECWGDDVPEGKVTSFSIAVRRNPDESIIFSWVTWPSKALREEGMKKVMAHPLMRPGANAMPFDGKRLIYGGFQVILDA